jgi:Protein of unknown function (DUF2924)
MARQRETTIEIATLQELSRTALRTLWKEVLGKGPPLCIGRDVLALGIAHAVQERRYGGLTKAVAKDLDRILAQALNDGGTPNASPAPTPLPRTGTVLVREWRGTTHHVTIVDDGFLWNGQTHRSLSAIAEAITGAKWNGPRFFGMRQDSATHNSTERPHGRR